MERRVTSHTEEEEMNQRRLLLAQARKGVPAAIKQLMDLYQVRVYSGDSVKSLKIRQALLASHAFKPKPTRALSKPPLKPVRGHGKDSGSNALITQPPVAKATPSRQSAVARRQKTSESGQKSNVAKKLRTPPTRRVTSKPKPRLTATRAVTPSAKKGSRKTTPKVQSKKSTRRPMRKPVVRTTSRIKAKVRPLAKAKVRPASQSKKSTARRFR